MKKGLIVIFIVGFAQLLCAQTNSIKDELELKQYAKDTSAEAVVLYDVGKSYFSSAKGYFELVFERSAKVKVFNKAGFKFAQISIPFYYGDNECEKIEDLQGKTYNLEDGNVRISDLDLKNTYIEKKNEHWRLEKFALPEIKEGSVFEFSYTIKSPYFFNLQSWAFQNRIPVIYSEYTTKMTPFWEYIYILQNATKFDEFKKYVDDGFKAHWGTFEYNDVVYDFVMKDVPAFKDESYITSIDDYLVKINFQLAATHRPSGENINIMSTWKKLSEELLKNEFFGTYLKHSISLGKKIVDTMQIETKPPLEKAKIIDHFVKSNFNWNESCYNFTNKSAKDFLQKKTGNSAEINLFLIGMLKAAGLDVYPVVLSTRDNGKIKMDYPFLHFFNYVVAAVKIDGSVILLDATEPLCDFGQVPTRCINDKGMIVQKDKEEWVDLRSTTPSSIVYDFNLKLNDTQDSVYQNSKVISTGYDAIDYRNEFLTSYKELKKELQGINSLEEDSLRPENLNQIEKPFGISYNNRNAVESVEDKIIVSPFCDAVITENPLKQTTRNHPVDMIYPQSKIFQSTIVIPKGYKLLNQPDNMNVDNDLVKIQYVSSTQNANTIKVTGSYEFKKDIYEVKDYHDLQAYFNNIVDKFNEKVVFVK
jgi:hypothetical protein